MTVNLEQEEQVNNIIKLVQEILPSVPQEMEFN